MKQFDSRRVAFTPYGFTCELWTPARMPRPDRHKEVELNFLTGGALTYLLGGQRATIGAGSLAVFWAAIPHQIVDHSGEDVYFVVTVPLSEFLHAGIDHDVVHRVLHGELLIEQDSDASDELKFRQWEREFRNGDPASVVPARLEIRARLLRLARGLQPRKTSEGPPVNLSRADQLACFIAQNYHQPMTSQSIADAAGLHPNYAMSLFRDTFGTTMTRFATQHRIWHAQRLLVTTDQTILTVAMESGFQSLSRFNEAFKDATGCSPRQFRKAHVHG